MTYITNEYETQGDTTTLIISTKMGVFRSTFDSKDVDLVTAYRWNISKEGADLFYVRSSSKIEGRSCVGLHRLLSNTVQKKGNEFVIDHIDGDSLNNKRENLRLVSNRDNIRKRKDKNNGVSRFSEKRGGRWFAQIALKKTTKSIHLGTFDTREEAEAQYKRALDIIEFATLKDLHMLRDAHKQMHPLCRVGTSLYVIHETGDTFEKSSDLFSFLGVKGGTGIPKEGRVISGMHCFRVPKTAFIFGSDL